MNYVQAVWMHDRLKAADVDVRDAHAGHGLKGDDAAKAEKAILNFFDRRLAK